MNIHKLTDVLEQAIEDKTFQILHLSTLYFQRGNYTYSIKGKVVIKEGLVTFVKINTVLEYHIASEEETELKFTESEKKLLLNHLYKLEL